MEKLTVVRLYGTLGAKFGRIHKIYVNTGTEAIKALCYTLPGFQQFLYSAKDKGMSFGIFYGNKTKTLSNINDPCGNADVRIAPVLNGSKRTGIFQAIMGAAIIGAAIAMGPLGAGVIASSTAWTIGLSGAVSFMGGVYQMLSPQTQGLQTRQDADNKPSYAFGGPVNTVAMGNIVGVLYGKREIGGQIISYGVVAEDQ